MNLPPCHRKGSRPRGYRLSDTKCHDCVVKFSCGEGERYVDGELVAVAAGVLTVMQAQHRVDRRRALVQLGRRVPLALHPGAHILGLEDVRPMKRRDLDKRMLGQPTRVVRNSDTPRSFDRAGRVLPPPREITPDEMRATLARVDIGQLAPLQIGQTVERLVTRGRKEGSRFLCRFTESGYLTDELTFGSLSSAATWHMGSHRAPGWIDLSKPYCRLYDAHGNQIQ